MLRNFFLAISLSLFCFNVQAMHKLDIKEDHDEDNKYKKISSIGISLLALTAAFMLYYNFNKAEAEDYIYDLGDSIYDFINSKELYDFFFKHNVIHDGL